jgi:hypothetical protein
MSAEFLDELPIGASGQDVADQILEIILKSEPTHAGKNLDYILFLECPRYPSFNTHTLDQLQVVLKYFLAAMSSTRAHSPVTMKSMRDMLHSVSGNAIRIHPFMVFEVGGVNYAMSAFADDHVITMCYFLADEYMDAMYETNCAGMSGVSILKGRPSTDSGENISGNRAEKSDVLRNVRERLQLGKVLFSVGEDDVQPDSGFALGLCDKAAQVFIRAFKDAHKELFPKEGGMPIRLREVRAEGVDASFKNPYGVSAAGDEFELKSVDESHKNAIHNYLWLAHRY